MTTTITRRIEVLEAASNPVAPLRFVFLSKFVGDRITRLCAQPADGEAIAQGTDEPEESFVQRVIAAFRQAPGQAVVMLDESDLAL